MNDLSQHVARLTVGMSEHDLRGMINFLAGWIESDEGAQRAFGAVSQAAALASKPVTIPDACFDAFQDENT